MKNQTLVLSIIGFAVVGLAQHTPAIAGGSSSCCSNPSPTTVAYVLPGYTELGEEQFLKSTQSKRDSMSKVFGQALVQGLLSEYRNQLITLADGTQALAVCATFTDFDSYSAAVPALTPSLVDSQDWRGHCLGGKPIIHDDLRYMETANCNGDEILKSFQDLCQGDLFCKHAIEDKGRKQLEALYIPCHRD